jgi:CheY-like chemotaxis protein
LIEQLYKGRWQALVVINVPKPRILVVDDYPDALEIWGLYLRAHGYDVETASDGLEAVDKAQAQHPDVVVLDLELPGISGFEAAVRLRQGPDTSLIPLIAATGYSHMRQLNQAKASGFDSIMIKPCDPAALVAEIERLLIGSGSRATQRQPAAVNRSNQNR